MLFQVVSFSATIKILSYWPKTMDYSKAFWPKSMPFFVLFLLLTGRFYEAEICAIPLLFRCSFRWYHFLPQSKFSVFDQKPWTIRSQAFWPKSRPFFVVFLLLTGRCYEAEICAILLLFRCSFRWYHFLPQSKFSVFGQKPWTIVRRFGRNRGHSLWCSYSSLEGAMKLKFVPFRSSLDALSGGIIFCQSQNVSVFVEIRGLRIVRRIGRNQDHSLWCSYSSLEGAMIMNLPFCSSFSCSFRLYHFLPKLNISVFGR